MDEGIYRVSRVPPRRQPPPLRPIEPHGQAAVGRIAKLSIGQGFGFIRLTNDRQIYFHRADLRAGTSINTLQVGDPVVFELLEDRISGARALHVARRQPAR